VIRVTRDWHRLAGRFEVGDDLVFVHVGADRSHIIQVEAHPDGWELSGMVTDEHRLERAELDAAELWRRNRLLNLVGYVVDQEGNARVTAWLPYAGTTPVEFQETVRQVAIEADRLEFYLTGQDVE
jgi:hypothetical protein